MTFKYPDNWKTVFLRVWFSATVYDKLASVLSVIKQHVVFTKKERYVIFSISYCTYEIGMMICCLQKNVKQQSLVTIWRKY